MQLTPLLLTALASTTALAAPTPAPQEAKSMVATTSQWTIKSFKRTCASGDTTCSFTYSIDTKSGTPTPCSYSATGNPASRASYSGKKCGAFTISSSWSGQFGDNSGFSTLAVTNGQQIIYPAYTDKQLATGGVVSLDQSYQPQNLP